MGTADQISGDFDIAALVFDHPGPISLPPLPAQALLALGECYRQADRDPKSSIPSYLQAAIENALRLIVEPASPYAERRAVPRYQDQRSGGTDIGPSGQQLEPGS